MQGEPTEHQFETSRLIWFSFEFGTGICIIWGTEVTTTYYYVPNKLGAGMVRPSAAACYRL